MKPLSKIKPKKKRDMQEFTDSPVVLLCDIRKLRRDRGTALREAAVASGISPATLARMEAGASIDLPTALKAEKFYELPINQIWKLQ